jgi:hypothetical protein
MSELYGPPCTRSAGSPRRPAGWGGAEGRKGQKRGGQQKDAKERRAGRLPLCRLEARSGPAAAAWGRESRWNRPGTGLEVPEVRIERLASQTPAAGGAVIPAWREAA